MPSRIISARAFDFAVSIVKLSRRMSTRGADGRHIAWQLTRCGTSVGANAEEAQEAQTKADFVSKLAVSRKECREALYWLRLAIAVDVAAANEVGWEMKEAGELLAMLRSAIITAQASSSRSEQGGANRDAPKR